MGSNPIEADTTSTQTFGPLDNRDVQLAGMSPQDRAAVAALPPGTALLLVGHEIKISPSGIPS